MRRFLIALPFALLAVLPPALADKAADKAHALCHDVKSAKSTKTAPCCSACHTSQTKTQTAQRGVAIRRVAHAKITPPAAKLKAAKPKAAKKSDPQLDVALLTAATTGDTKGAERALNKGANIEARDGQYAFTPLMWASWRARLGTMRLLIARGADVNAKTHPPSPQAVVLREGSDMAGDAYQAKGVTVITRVKSGYGVLNDGVTPLLLAAASGSGQAVKLLLDKGADVKAAAGSGDTPLEAAAFTGHLPSVQALLAKGAPVNARDAAGGSALIVAVLEGHTAVVRELLHHGADPSATFRGLTAWQLAQTMQRDDIARLLAQAAKKPRNTAQRSQPAKPNTLPAPADVVQIIKADGSVEIVR